MYVLQFELICKIILDKSISQGEEMHILLIILLTVPKGGKK